MSKQLYDNLRFVYETEDTILAGSIVSIPTVDGPGGPLPIDPINIGGGGGTTPSGSAPKFIPKNPTNTTGPDQDKELMSGASLVSACWVLNEYPGLHPWKEDGRTHIWAGSTNFISDAPFSGFRIIQGFGWSGQGFSPDLFQGFKVELFTLDGSVACVTYGFENPHCRYPTSAFPLDAQVCDGPNIGGNPGPITGGHASIETMWDRFQACMRTYYPQCGPEPTEE